MTQNQHSYTPAFLSRFPRSLSSLSLGMKKKTDNNSVASPTTGVGASVIDGTATGSTTPSQGILHGRTQSVSAKHNVPVVSGKKKHSRNGSRAQSQEDVPPPLPQRNNVGRKSLPTSPEHAISPDLGKHVQISDLDTSLKSSKHNVSIPSEPSNSRKRSKTKNKAHSDPKMSTQLFIQMEARNCMSDGSEPPPLPPRQASLAEPVQSLSASGESGSGSNVNGGSRFPPNSINTLLNYPLISTCTPVRDNFTPFPLSHRPNIVQQLQQSQSNKSGVSITKSKQKSFTITFTTITAVNATLFTCKIKNHMV